MSNEAGLGALVSEIREASNSIAQADAKNARRLDSIEQTVNELTKK
jgi:hypothetical protein